jgi:hypothetical protein
MEQAAGPAQKKGGHNCSAHCLSRRRRFRSPCRSRFARRMTHAYHHREERIVSTARWQALEKHRNVRCSHQRPVRRFVGREYLFEPTNSAQVSARHSLQPGATARAAKPFPQRRTRFIPEPASAGAHRESATGIAPLTELQPAQRSPPSPGNTNPSMERSLRQEVEAFCTNMVRLRRCVHVKQRRRQVC